MIPFTGFAPDLDPVSPGVITSCNQIVPTLKGVAGAPTPFDAGYPALADECRGAATVTRLDGVRRLFAGTEIAIYELLSSVWSDVSRVGAYTGGVENPWRFAQFGNTSLATNQTDKIQYSISGDFADIADAPKARIIFTVGGAIMALAIDDARVGGDRPDAWWASNLYDYSGWTPGPTSQAAFGYFLDTPGEIRGGRALGPNAVAYKEESIYIGQYVGPPTMWDWEVVSDNVGAISQESIVSIGTSHLFIGKDDFWIFDGTRPQSIGAPVREWFLSNSDQTYRYRTRGYYDKKNAQVWWFYAPNSSAGALTDALVYNIKSEKWGYAKTTIECAVEYVSPEVTWDDWPPGPATDYENIVDLPFDSPAFDTSVSVLAVFGTDNKIYSMVGPCADSNIVTGDFGADDLYTTLQNVMPRFLQMPTSTNMTNYTKDMMGADLVVGNAIPINGNKYNVLASARYHRLKFDMVGDHEIVGYTPQAEQDGTE